MNKSPQNYKYTIEKEVVIVEGDFICDEDFFIDKMAVYFPAFNEEIRYLYITGNLIIKGQLNDKDYQKKLSIRVDGDLYAESVWLEKLKTLLVKGNVYVNRYVYINIYTFDYKPDKIVFKNQIETPLFIIGSSDFRFRGRFSKHCLVIKNRLSNVQLYHPFKIYSSYILKEELLKGEYYKIRPEQLIEHFEEKKEIFKDNYYPAEEDINPIETYFSHVAKYIKQKKYKEAQKELKSLKVQPALGDVYPQRMHILYYEILILIGLDKDKYTNKIEKNCINITKNILYGSWDSKMFPREKNIYVVNYLSALHEKRGEYQKALELLKKYNKGDKEYYVKRTNLLLKLGKETEALIPARIATEHFKSTDLDKFKTSKAYQEYDASLQKEFTIPKGNKQHNLKSFIFTKIYRGVDTHDSYAPVTYKGDVFWNSDLIANKDLSSYFKVQKNTRIALVVLGDLYVKGRLYLNSIDMYIEGNLFADTIHLQNAQFECTGNVTATKEIIINDQTPEILTLTDNIIDSTINNITGNSLTYIFGDLRTPLLAIDPEFFYIGGNIVPNTVCIPIKKFELKNTKKLKVYTEKDLDENINMSDVFNSNLYERLVTDTLIKK